MFAIGRNRTLKRLIKHVGEVERLVNRALEGDGGPLPRNPQGLATRPRLSAALDHLTRLHSRLTIRLEHNGGVSPDDLSALFRAFREMAQAVGITQGSWVDEGLLADVIKCLNDLAAAIEKARKNRARAAKRPRDVEAEALWDALRRLHRKLAKRTPLEELRAWIEDGPMIDFDDPLQVCRAARLFAMELVPDQVWEVRYRSEAPGRPLVLANCDVSWPDYDVLESCVRQYGQRPFIIAVRKPTWRQVWTVFPDQW